MNVIERFLNKVSPEPNSGCWLWDGSYFNSGYGRFAATSRKSVLAHRFSYQVHHGEIPTGHYVCHHCDNSACVNPDHLFAGTPSQNSDDMVSKRRQAVGDSIRPTKLTDEQVRWIKTSKKPISELAYWTGASYGVVWAVRNNKSYKWVRL